MKGSLRTATDEYTVMYSPLRLTGREQGNVLAPCWHRHRRAARENCLEGPGRILADGDVDRLGASGQCGTVGQHNDTRGEDDSAGV